MNCNALIDALSGYIETNQYGTIHYYNSAGVLHRTDGPAVTHADGAQFWYLNGRLHRMDGPVVVYPNSQKFWFIEDCAVSQEKFNECVSRIAEEEPRSLAS